MGYQVVREDVTFDVEGKRVRLLASGLEALSRLFEKEIAQEALFVPSESPHPMLTNIRVEMTVPGGEDIVFHGDVIYTIEPERASQMSISPGMGLQIRDLDLGRRREIKEYLTGLTKGDAAPVDVPPVRPLRQAAVPPPPPVRAAPARPVPPPPQAPPDPASDVEAILDDFRSRCESQDYYKVLGVPRTSSLEGIERAYKEQMLRLRLAAKAPDLTADQIKKLKSAYNILKVVYSTLADQGRRGAYDQRLKSKKEGAQEAQMRAKAQELWVAASKDIAAALGTARLASRFDPQNEHIQRIILALGQLEEEGHLAAPAKRAANQ